MYLSRIVERDLRSISINHRSLTLVTIRHSLEPMYPYKSRPKLTMASLLTFCGQLPGTRASDPTRLHMHPPPSKGLLREHSDDAITKTTTTMNQRPRFSKISSGCDGLDHTDSTHESSTGSDDEVLVFSKKNKLSHYNGFADADVDDAETRHMKRLLQLKEILGMEVEQSSGTTTMEPRRHRKTLEERGKEAGNLMSRILERHLAKKMPLPSSSPSKHKRRHKKDSESTMDLMAHKDEDPIPQMEALVIIPDDDISLELEVVTQSPKRVAHLARAAARSLAQERHHHHQPTPCTVFADDDESWVPFAPPFRDEEDDSAQQALAESTPVRTLDEPDGANETEITHKEDPPGKQENSTLSVPDRSKPMDSRNYVQAENASPKKTLPPHKKPEDAEALAKSPPPRRRRDEGSKRSPRRRVDRSVPDDALQSKAAQKERNATECQKQAPDPQESVEDQAPRTMASSPRQVPNETKKVLKTTKKTKKVVRKVHLTPEELEALQRQTGERVKVVKSRRSSEREESKTPRRSRDEPRSKTPRRNRDEPRSKTPRRSSERARSVGRPRKNPDETLRRAKSRTRARSTRRSRTTVLVDDDTPTTPIVALDPPLVDTRRPSEHRRARRAMEAV